MLFVFLNISMLSLIAFIFVLDLTMYTLFLSFLIYIMVFFFFLEMGIEILALLTLLIYLGGVLIMFVFSMYFMDFSKIKPLYKYKGAYYDFFVRVFFFFLLLLTPVLVSRYSQVFDLLFFTQIVAYAGSDKALLLDYLTICMAYKKLYPPVMGFNDLTLYCISLKLYWQFWMGCFLLFLLFLLVLMVLIILSSSNNGMSYHLFIRKLAFDKFVKVSFQGKGKIFFYSYSHYSEKFIASSLLFDLNSSNYYYLWSFSDLLLITLFFSFFFVLLSCFLFKNFNFVKFLMISEIFVALSTLTLASFSCIHFNLDGMVLSIFLIGIFAAETALGLAMFNLGNLSSTYFSNFKL